MRLKEMSRGMREKVQIALAMSRQETAYLLDEPISGVDPAAQVILDSTARNLSEDSLVFISTHLVHDLEPILDGIVLMRHGKVLLAGGVDDLRAQHNMSIDQLCRVMQRLLMLGIVAVPLALGSGSGGGLAVVSLNFLSVMAENQTAEAMPLGFVPALALATAVLIWRTVVSWNEKVSLA